MPNQKLSVQYKNEKATQRTKNSFSCFSTFAPTTEPPVRHIMKPFSMFKWRSWLPTGEIWERFLRYGCFFSEQRHILVNNYTFLIALWGKTGLPNKQGVAHPGEKTERSLAYSKQHKR